MVSGDCSGVNNGFYGEEMGDGRGGQHRLPWRSRGHRVGRKLPLGSSEPDAGTKTPEYLVAQGKKYLLATQLPHCELGP